MPQPLALKCPTCDAPLSAPEGRETFYCQFCGTPVVLSHWQDEPSSAPRHDDERDRVVPIPSKVQVEEFGNDLRLSWSWFSPVALFLIPFCIAWNAFLIFWYSIALSGNGPPGAFRWIMLIFPLAHVAVGVGLLYACLTMLFNRTVIWIRSGQLTVRHGPIPSWGNHTVFVDDLDQLFVRHETRNRKNGGMAHSYKLCALLRSGRELELLPCNDQVSLVRGVEHLVETHLGIEDRRVTGEHRD